MSFREETVLQRENLFSLVEKVLHSLQYLGSEFEDERKALSGLQERLFNERFHLAVLGQFKRGKSTFINALLGAEILPTAVLPLTAIPTFLLFGFQPRACVYFEEGEEVKWEGDDPKQLVDFLAQFVTEAGNPKNQKKVSQVEVFYPSSLLRAGVVLIDTPGIGSTFRHNTEVTLNFLPQCDAAIFILSADPPITEAEVEFLKSVRSRVAHLFFVFNKVDYLSEEEVSSLTSFLIDIFREQIGMDDEPVIFPVSARMALEGQKRKDPALFHRSGIDGVSAYLLTFLAREKSHTLQVAIARKIVDVLDTLIMRLELFLRSLEMPILDLDERLQVFAEKIKEIQRERVQIGDLLQGERKRMVALLEEQAETLRQKARKHLSEIVMTYLDRNTNNLQEKIQNALAEAIPEFFEHELAEMAYAFERKITEVLEPYQKKVDELIEVIRRKASELFDIPYHAPKSSDAFVMQKRPYWVTHKWYTHFSFLPEGALSVFLPASIRRGKLVKQVNEEIDELVTSNVENLRWATLQNLDQTFRQFHATLDEHLAKTITATHGAIEKARLQRTEQEERIAEEIARFRAVIELFRGLQVEFAALG
ncbi:MAG: dynamin family protein [Atribacterota bacterium]|nr:dynamin family protein [Atribacterota bacterium]